LNPDVVDNVEAVVIVSNHADFDEPSSWGCTATHPRSRPLLALAFLADKYMIKTPCEGTPPELKVPTRDALAMLASFIRAHPDKRLLVFLYPDKAQMADEAERLARLDTKAPCWRRRVCMKSFTLPAMCAGKASPACTAMAHT
jgi:hypothetical protein